MGAEISIEAGYINAKAKRLKGARIMTDMITVTGTENLLMAAVMAEGTTTLEYMVRLKEDAESGALLEHLQRRGAPSVVAAEYRSLRGLKPAEQ